MTTTEIAAQAGDEPMRAAFEAKYIPGTVYRSQWNDGTDYANYDTEVRWRLFKDGAAYAAQVSPRATADVERYSADEICQAAVKAGLGILECNSLIVTLKGA